MSPYNHAQLVSMLSWPYLAIFWVFPYFVFSLRGSFFSGKVLLGHRLQQRGARTSSDFPCLLLPEKGGQVFSLGGVKTGVCPGVGLEGGLGSSPTHLLVVCAGNQCSTLLLPCIFTHSLSIASSSLKSILKCSLAPKT